MCVSGDRGFDGSNLLHPHVVRHAYCRVHLHSGDAVETQPRNGHTYDGTLRRIPRVRNPHWPGCNSMYSRLVIPTLDWDTTTSY